VQQIEVRVQERQQAAIRVADDDAVWRRPEPLECLVERRTCALGQRGLDAGPRRERCPTP